MAFRGLAVAANGDTLRDGVRFRNIGCNYRYGISRSWGQLDPNGFTPTPPAEWEAGLEWLHSVGVRVVRVAALPFYPNQWRAALHGGKEYASATPTDRAAYYAAYIDPFVAKCRELDMTVLLNLFPRYLTASDITGEDGKAMYRAGTRTRALATAITQEIAARYLHEEAVGGYIMANEVNNYISFPTDHWHAVNTAFGTAASYDHAATMYSQDEMRGLFSWWYGVVRAIDTQRICLTGNGATRYYKPGPIGDIPNPVIEYYRELVLDNPMNGSQIHWYNNIGYCSPNDKGLDAMLAGCRHWSAAAGKAFVLGEWGDQHIKIGGVSAVGSTVTIVVQSGADSMCCEPGDEVEIIDASAWSGRYVLDTVAANRRQATATVIGTLPSTPYSGSAARLLYQAAKFQRVLDAIIDSGTDVSLLWNYDTDPLYPRGESCEPDGPNHWQGALIAAANARLAQI